MDQASTWITDLSRVGSEVLATIVGYLPNLLGAALLLLVGWIIGRAVRGGTLKLGGGVNRLLDRFMTSERLSRFRLSARALALIANVAFWLIVLFFITAATRVAGLDAFSSWLDRIVAYLPTLLAGGLIILVGYLVSDVVRDLVSAGLASAGLQQSDLFGTVAQGATFLTAVVIGIDQVGIDVTFLVTIISIGLAAVLASLSLAFGLGARTFVSNLIGAHYLQQQLQAGQRARIGDIEGEILELTPTSVILATDQGRTTIPAKVFNESTTVLMTPAEEND